MKKCSGHNSCWRAWLIQRRAFGIMLGKGVGRPGCSTGSLGADCRVLSGGLENTNTRTISKCLFRKTNRQQLLDMAPPRAKIHWREKGFCQKSAEASYSPGWLERRWGCLPPSQPRNPPPASSGSALTAEQTTLISWSAIPRPTPQFAFSRLTFCHFSDLNQLIIWSELCQKELSAPGRNVWQEAGGRQGKEG